MRNDTIAEIKLHNGLPTLFVNGDPIPFGSYACYLDDKARYEDFALAGCRLYTFPAYFTGRGINTSSNIGPFRKGIYDKENESDFSEFDREAERIVRACPEAFIFPRVCMTMPAWWDEKYPDECNYTLSGARLRVSMSSERWRQDAAGMLTDIIRHVENTPFASNFIGYHIAAGSTEEWYHFSKGDDFGGLGPAAQKGFLSFAKKLYGEKAKDWKIPESYSEYKNNGEPFLSPEHEMLLAFLEYTNDVVAEDINYFCSIVRQHTNRKKIAGVFYGYTMQGLDPRLGHNALRKVLECKDVDFIAAPNSYYSGPQAGFDGSTTRQPGTDWPSMPPLDSIRLAGKLLVNENDTRTFLSRPLKESRSGIAPSGKYEDGVWLGPERRDWSLWLLRRCFGRTLITGAGGWWFDMWGGWYASDEIMAEMKDYFALQQEELKLAGRQSICETALINDEEALKTLNCAAGLIMPALIETRHCLSVCGCGYDVYDICSGQNIPVEQYKLIIFACVEDSPKLRQLIERCRDRGVNLLFSYLPGYGRSQDVRTVSELVGIKLEAAPNANEGPIRFSNGMLLSGPSIFKPGLRINETCDEIVGRFKNGEAGFIRKHTGKSDTWYCVNPGLEAVALRIVQEASGVHHYAELGDVVYANRHFLCIHAAVSGKKRIVLPGKAEIAECFGQRTWCSNRFDVEMKQYETLLFRLEYPPAPVG
ncbi:MAG: hypothetical protein LBU21_00985 [Treponema sp.]|nr:hypothetical protein [Treponema sp.]